MFYKGNINTYDFTKFRTTRTFGNAVKNGISTTYTADNKQNQLAKLIR